jgi:hypothetical protein
MEVKVNFEDYCVAAKVERHNLTEPNKALQRMNCIVTDRAPSSTLCANARSSLSLNVRQKYDQSFH